MSFNQSKTEKNDAVYRKSGRSSSFNQQRGPSGAYGRGSGGPAPSLSSNKSFNKKSNIAQGGQYRANPSPVNSTESNNAPAARGIHNGTHVQPQLHGASDGPVAKASESTAQRSPKVVPNAPTTQPPPVVSSDTTAPTSPAKGDASKAFPFQFGSIVPGFMNGVAIPPRTSSAPPNLDEQKHAQAHHDSVRSAVPSVPIPPVPKQQQPPRNDAGVTEKSNARETHLGAKAKKDPQVPVLTPASQMQKPSVVPVTGISMSTPFQQQSQAPLQFGGPNPQIQSQGMSSTPLHIPIPMPIPIGNVPQVQQPVFVPGLQPHPMHPHGIMHSGHNISFTHQMGHQLPHQLGNMGIGMGPQYPQQQGGKFAGPRKTTPVKITQPDTHEELRLDKRTYGYSDWGSFGARSHPNVPSQSQPGKSIATSQPTNYYPSSSYGSSSPYYQPNSIPLTSSQITPNAQPPIFNYPVNNGPQNVAFMNSPSLNSQPVNKVSTPIPRIAEPPTVERSCEVPNVISSASTGVASVTIKQCCKYLQSADVPDTTKEINDSAENACSDSMSLSVSGIKDRPNLEANKAKITSKGRKKRKVILQKADAAGSTYDLYNAYKGPEEKKETVLISESTENESTSEGLKQLSADSAQLDSPVSEKCGHNKAEPDDWEDAADMSTPKLGVDDKSQQVIDGIGSTAKKYSRDFLLKFAEQCIEITADIADSLMSFNNSRDSHPSPGRTVDRSKIERRGNVVAEEDRWNKAANASAENACSDSMSLSVSGIKDRPNLDANKAKITSKGRKKRKEILQKADAAGPTVSQNASSENAWPEERLRDMSLSTIREYYSARDVNEVAQCIRDLNSPAFHPSMVSVWVMDSYERKDTERDLLAKLLVKLGKSQDGLLSQTQLNEGFGKVLCTLEDDVNDAPRAPEFLGRIFAELITESIVSLNEIGQLIHDGGEEPGSLLEVGLAADVLGSTLEAIKHEKGDAVLSEIRTSSNLWLETFRPPNNSTTSRKLEKFI